MLKKAKFRLLHDEHNKKYACPNSTCIIVHLVVSRYLPFAVFSAGALITLATASQALFLIKNIIPIGLVVYCIYFIFVA
jgi:hypothetical protein